MRGFLPLLMAALLGGTLVYTLVAPGSPTVSTAAGTKEYIQAVEALSSKDNQVSDAEVVNHRQATEPFVIDGDSSVTTSGNPGMEPKFVPRSHTNFRFKPDTPYLTALQTCETLKCLRDAHQQPKGEAKYNFPHFMIAGWSKCATTSLWKNLYSHPQTLAPREKEPMLFTDRCKHRYGHMECADFRVSDYIDGILKKQKFIDAKGQIAPYEATPRILGLGGEFAANAFELMPWYVPPTTLL